MSSTTTTTIKATAKGAKKSKIIVLHITADKLSRFPATPSISRSASIKAEPSPSVQPPEPADKSSEANSTPIPPNANDDTDGNSLAPPGAENKKKRPAGNASGKKRAPPAIDPDAPPRERARPGPKKKPRLADGSIDRTIDGKKVTVAGPNPVTSHKLGPKANTGAINAGLRALDRTGKPCRKWERKPLQLKSFTGTMWNMSSWNAPVRDAGFAGDVKSDTTASSDVKPNGSSALPSESGQGDFEMTNGIESSPAPAMAAAS
ncbi:INO80 complex, subunit Ies4 [Neohortaea acidophila]|uniref:INO80 complex, subunit Ies4 n=1 Tax=Neohortaea acidophila TaxID=245834 RepID=A0A6A6PUJ0_9PEZI|nr:INO80 complex, subunit Ies4 [Neohortaea acidophila]KAF2483436.1 INO80 complex, subunit Ies4 [Neohortaea acidophila]